MYGRDKLLIYIIASVISTDTGEVIWKQKASKTISFGFKDDILLP